MTFFGSKRRLLHAALCSVALVGLTVLPASAQQIGYYTFDAPATANPAEYSYSFISNGSQQPNPCGSDPSNLLFCFNNPAGSASTPSFIEDPNISDPNYSGGQWVLQMTPAASGQAASMWFSVPQNVYGGFNAYFQFKITPNSGSEYTADGFAFVIQNSNGATSQGQNGGASSITLPTYQGSTLTCSESQQGGSSVVGGGGGCMGYTGIDNSVALEFDTYANNMGAGDWDPTDISGSQNDNHIALQSCGLNGYTPLPNSPVHLGSTNCLVTLGAAPNPIAATPTSTLISNPTNSQVPALSVTLADGNTHQVVVVYNGPNDTPGNYLYVYLDPTFQSGTVTPVSSAQPIFSGPFDITQYINLIGDTIEPAYVGFTSGTGDYFEQHEITGWTFTPHTPVEQTEPVNTSPSSPSTTTFSFGTHNYSVTYPPNVVPAGTNMTVIATQIPQSIFDALMVGTPFAGSQCQEYDDTGTDNTGSPYCIFYNVSCQDNNGNAISCPAPSGATECTTEPNNTSCITLNSSYNNANTPLSPGFLQGDPLYSPIQSNNGGTSSFVNCQGECAVTDGQRPVYIDQVVTVNNVPTLVQYGPVAVSNATPSSFDYSGAPTAVPPYNGFGNPEFVTSLNLQNIFTGYMSGNLDGSSTGKTQSFSDFIVTSTTIAPGTTTTLGVTNDNPTENQVDSLTATVSATTAQFGAPAGTVTFSNGLPVTMGNTVCGPVTLVPGNITLQTVATCSSYSSPESTAPLTLYATYNGDPNHASSSSPGQAITVAPSTITPVVTFNPSSGSQTYGTAIGSGVLDASVALPSGAGTISYTATMNNAMTTIGTGTILSVGSYTITATFTPAPANTGAYSSAFATAPYIVNAATLTVTPNPVTMTYGGTVPTPSPSYSGFVNGTVAVPGAPTCTITGIGSTTAANTYPTASSCSGGTAPANYVFSYLPGSVTVSPAMLTVTPYPSSAMMTYGGAVPSLTPSYSGYVNGTVAVTVPPSCTPGVTSTTPAGPYPTASSCSGGTAPANYVFSYVTGLVTVGPATLTVKPSPNPATMTYGGAVPSLTPGYSGFVNGTVTVTGAPSCTPGVTSTTPAGTHTGVSSCSGGTAPTDYAFAYAPGSVIISQASQTISFTLPAGVNYGVAPIAFPANASSGLPITYIVVSGPASITGTSSAPTLTISGAGTIKVTGSQGGNSNYLPATSVSQATVVTAVPLATVSPTSYNFGNAIYLGSILTKSFTITNTGDAAMIFSGDPLIAIVQGGNSDEFITVNLCPTSLAAGKSCTMTVTFIAGPFYNTQNATLMIKDNVAGSPQTVSLSAMVIDPVASLSATSLNFGSVKANSGAPTKTVTLTSAGGTALSITSVAIAGADSGDFKATTCPSSLAPKATCTITVTFKPLTKSPLKGSLVITTNAKNSPQSISLSGTGD
jgi:hypothetical protein